ncbi:MAG: hypothetical protein ACRDF4_05040 [Rhabdochlamydiaceae bacterium]
MGNYYDQGIKAPVWIVTAVNDSQTEALERAVHENGGAVLEWPAQSFMTTVFEMGKRGWKHVVDQKKPFTVDVNFVTCAVAKHIKKIFGPSAMLTGSQMRPYQHALGRRIETEDDYRRIFDEVLSLEAETELSNIFQMASRRSVLYISRSPVPTNVIQKLARNILTVGEENSTVSSKDMTNDELIETVLSEVDNLLNLQ